MKKSFLLLLLLAGIATSYSQRIVSKTFLISYTKSQIDSLLDRNGIPHTLFATTYDIDVYKLIYRTVSYDSTATTASGLMAVPKNKKCKFPMAVYHHGTIADKNSAPSRLRGDEPVIGMVMASIGYLVAEPDYLGLGDGSGLHPYQHAATEASASIDMLRSVREYCDSAWIRRNTQLFLFGYSQGGHACMATHRAIQNQLRGEFTVTAAVPMSGAYDMSGTMVQTMLSNNLYDQPGYLPYLALSWNPIYHIYDSIQHAFVHPYDSILPPLFDGTHSINAINNQMPNVPKNIFTSSELDTFINNLNSPFRLALRDNDVYDWLPACPVKILFCTADSYVPYMNSVVAIRKLRLNGCTQCDTLDVSDTYGHVDCAKPAIFYAQSVFDQYRTIDSCAGGLSITEPVVEAIKVSIYPNPAKTSIHLDINSNDHATATIADLSGRMLTVGTITGGSAQISIQGYASGLYILHVVTDKGLVSQSRLIVE